VAGRRRAHRLATVRRDLLSVWERELGWNVEVDNDGGLRPPSDRLLRSCVVMFIAFPISSYSDNDVLTLQLHAIYFAVGSFCSVLWTDKWYCKRIFRKLIVISSCVMK